MIPLQLLGLGHLDSDEIVHFFLHFIKIDFSLFVHVGGLKA